MAPKHPCIVCQKNVTNNSIACSVCSRWCHAACSDLEPAVIKYFDTQYATTGTHSWSCTGCNIAYTKLNTRIRQLENKQVELENAMKTNQAETAKNTDRIDKVEKDMTELRNNSKKEKEEIMKKTTSQMSREIMEREARKANLVIYGLPEPPFENKSGPARQRIDKAKVGDLFMALEVDVMEEDVKFAARVGKMTEAVDNNPRPLKMSFREQGVRERIFASAKKLPGTDFHKVSIVPDLTDMQRQDDKDLFKEAERMNQEMEEEDSENYFYRCVGRKGERTIVRLKRTERTNGNNRNSSGGFRNNGGFRTNGSDRNNRRTSQSSVNHIPLVRQEATTEEADSNNKRGRQEDSDDSVLESPNGSQVRQPPKKTTKARSN